MPNATIRLTDATEQVLVFDSGGTVESILTMTKVEVEAQQIDALYVINGLASMAAAVLGIPPLIVHAECIAGVGEGGRTGGTAIFTGLFFLLAIVLQPLLKVCCGPCKHCSCQ